MRCQLRRCVSMLTFLLMILLTYRYAMKRLQFSYVTMHDGGHNGNRSPAVDAFNRPSDGLSRYKRRHQCLAVLTGYPRIDGRLDYVVRLLRQLRQQVVVVSDDVTVPTNDNSKGDECQNPTDVFVYCDGDCGDTLRSEFSHNRWIEFRQLSDKRRRHRRHVGSISDRYGSDASMKSTATNKHLQNNPTVHIPTVNVSSDKNASVIGERSSYLQRSHSRLFRRHRGDRLTDDVYIELSGIRFVRDRWMSVSKNYRLMFDDLFLSDPSSSSTFRGRYGDVDSYCAILEDDLILAPDALIYLQAVERLMDVDSTVFTGSLFNDNSYPLYSIDSRSFRRIDHFAGLGFVMSGRRYIDELRPTWGGLQNWDEAIQRLVARRHLASVVPEVSRALHIRRRDQLKDAPSTISLIPRHPFESQRLNDVILTSGYDLTHLTKTKYDRRLAEMIYRGVYVDYIADALFFRSADDVIIYWGCSEDADLDRLLVERDLWGVGNGGIVRGSYRGTLEIRYLTALVLVVSRLSEFRLFRVASRPSFQIDDYSTIAPSSVERPYLGIVHRLSSEFRVVVGNVNETCHSVCVRTGNASMTSSCDIRGLWLANERCEVLKKLIPGCRTCIRGTIDTYVDGVLPAVEADDRGEKCASAYPHYISCHTASPMYRRLCVCRQ